MTIYEASVCESKINLSDWINGVLFNRKEETELPWEMRIDVKCTKSEVRTDGRAATLQTVSKNRPFREGVRRLK